MTPMGKKLETILLDLGKIPIDVPTTLQHIAEALLMERERCAKLAEENNAHGVALLIRDGIK